MTAQILSLAGAQAPQRRLKFLGFNIKDDANEPEIKVGDIVLVDLDEKPEEGKFAIIGAMEPEPIIGKFHRKDNTVLIHRLNAESLFLRTEDIHFQARVVSVNHLLV